MPDFDTFRINKALLRVSSVYRQSNLCLDDINVNNPKYNSELKVRTVITDTYDTYVEWRNYILYLNELLKNPEDVTKT